LGIFYGAEGLDPGIDDELRRCIAKESLAHVHDGLDRKGGGGGIDDGPA